MPRVDVWIRKADYEVWKRIADKPGFLSGSIRALMSTDNMRAGAALLDIAAKDNSHPEILGVLKSLPQVQSLKFCKHGYDPKFCKFAKKGMCK